MIYKIIPIILSLFIYGCCSANNFTSFKNDDEYVGTWHAGNNYKATLDIYPKGDQIYLLKFISGEYKWEGIGYKYGNNIIAIFRYKNVPQQGFVTFTLRNSNRITYTSRSPDGSIRAESYYIKKNVP